MIIKDSTRLLEIAKTLNPISFKLFLFLILTYPPGIPFKLTYFEMGQWAQIKAPYQTMLAIINAGFLDKKIVGKHQCEYTLLVDLIQF